MGSKTIFPGANDNASGTALLLALAKRMVEQPLEYTTVFIFFAGEEAGLVGSSFYVSQPVYPLSNIRFLLNLDLMGNGEEGITVVNATVFENEFKLLQEINNKGKLLVAINSRGKAQNSDHYYFTEKGVPSFFWYTLGKRKAYHDVNDIAETVPLYEANDLLQLALAFSKQVISLPRK
jgi:Zn-dependent M28 family amino/carboxypeptidase